MHPMKIIIYLSKFAKSIGSKNILFMRHINTEFGDDILRQNDITPNSLGAELVGITSLPVWISGIIKSINEGKIKALFLIDDDIVSSNPELENVLAKLDLLDCQFQLILIKQLSLADIVFPSATYAEKNGTMVNFQGMIQRLKPAVSTVELDRAMDGMSLSRLDKFGTQIRQMGSGK